MTILGSNFITLSLPTNFLSHLAYLERTHMARTKQGAKDLPRIYVSSRISKVGIQRQEIRRLPPFSVRHNVHCSLH